MFCAVRISAKCKPLFGAAPQHAVRTIAVAPWERRLFFRALFFGLLKVLDRHYRSCWKTDPAFPGEKTASALQWHARGFLFAKFQATALLWRSAVIRRHAQFPRVTDNQVLTFAHAPNAQSHRCVERRFRQRIRRRVRI